MGKSIDLGNGEADLGKEAGSRFRPTPQLIGSMSLQLVIPELGEKLRELVELNCSVRGIAEALGIPPTTLRRNIASANSSNSRTDSKAKIEPTPAKSPKEQARLSALEASRQSKSAFQRNRASRPAIEEIDRERTARPNSETKSTNRIVHPAPIAANVHPIINDGLDGKGSGTEEGAPQMTPLEIYKLVHMSEST